MSLIVYTSLWITLNVEKKIKKKGAEMLLNFKNLHKIYIVN